ncbi:unnamed protein product [Euphydryas editha]|uniref:Uncharacterized protein n=1 Tax=Euphydryas editha TaxID=104508 RepID=A0AAU9UWC3_EUPED|nr:unnamed protein product [Euphydryas editha]CAH2103970.1 unnamed protein product [Euphydryas editha]
MRLGPLPGGARLRLGLPQDVAACGPATPDDWNHHLAVTVFTIPTSRLDVDRVSRDTESSPPLVNYTA